MKTHRVRRLVMCPDGASRDDLAENGQCWAVIFSHLMTFYVPSGKLT